MRRRTTHPKCGRGRSLAGQDKASSTCCWSAGGLGPDHDLCVQGTKSLVFLWDVKEICLCFNLIICPFCPAHHFGGLALEISRWRMDSKPSDSRTLCVKPQNPAGLLQGTKACWFLKSLVLESICIFQRMAVSIYLKWFLESGFFSPSDVQQLSWRMLFVV